MQKFFLYILTLISINLSAQNSWINIQYLSDDYPTEISWELLDSYNNIILESDSNFLITTLFDTTINLNSGIYTLNINDSYGDGLGGLTRIEAIDFMEFNVIGSYVGLNTPVVIMR